MSSDQDLGLRSPFSAIPATEWLASNELAFAVFDRYPVSPGHVLVVPRREVKTWWDATREERIALIDLADEVKAILQDRYAPDGWNLGVNIDEAGGQTVGHLHLHVIPRYDGDVPDPRGGIRHVIPSKGNWQRQAGEPPPPEYDGAESAVRLLDGIQRPLGPELLRLLGDTSYDRLDVAVAFVTPSGVEVIRDALADALERGLETRMLTSDYLDVTDPRALDELLDLAHTLGARSDPDAERGLELRAVETRRARGFHAKSYLFWSSKDGRSACLVGSSNLTRPALAENVEWNLEVDRIRAFHTAFDGLWSAAATVDADWIDAYRARRTAPPPSGRRPAEVVPEEPKEDIAPRPIQEEALDALEAARDDGHRSGLVVMATGLGKTWLAAFDSQRSPRVLFIAHREEILQQSLDVFRRVQPHRRLGLATGSSVDLDAQVVFVSVQWLHRNLDQLPRDRFDYVVVDEFHHAAAHSYRKVLRHLQPGFFLLGLTATPDRLDGADLLALTGDNLVYECSLVEGIERDELVPFTYEGIADGTVDYEPIPWRGGRFSDTELTAAVSTRERADHILQTWQDQGTGRTLAFCVTTAHADFMAEHFARNGVRAVAVHSAPTSAPRRRSIQQLEAGALDVVFSVDLFNEGLDVPAIETVLMLRPTQSPVVFLQQLGRGLRPHDDKPLLTVLDFIGNHRTFLERPRLLLALLGDDEPDPRRALELLRQGVELPAGCEINIELETIELLESLQPSRRGEALEAFIQARLDETGERPTAVQCYRAGYNPASVRARDQGWFDWLDQRGFLSQRESQAHQAADDFLRRVEREHIVKSFKLLTLRAIVERGWLWESAPLDELAEELRVALRNDPRLAADVADKSAEDPSEASAEAWFRYIRKNPVAAWAGEMRSNPDTAPFRIEGDALAAKLTVARELQSDVEGLVAELIDWRLVRYIDGLAAKEDEVAVLKVARNASGNPILFLRREQNPPLPHGEVTVLIEGREHIARFVKVACNVVRETENGPNVLPDILRRWFGDDAGASATRHQVMLEALDDGHLRLSRLE